MNFSNIQATKNVHKMSIGYLIDKKLVVFLSNHFDIYSALWKRVNCLILKSLYDKTKTEKQTNRNKMQKKTTSRPAQAIAYYIAKSLKAAFDNCKVHFLASLGCAIFTAINFHTLKIKAF